MKSTKKAFTIIELMLAMAFLATMMVAIAALVIQITSIYQKGISLRAVNSVGREIVSDLTRTINGARINVEVNPIPAKNSNTVGSTQINDAMAQYYVESVDSQNRQLGGAFCTGGYSYIWNTAENIRRARDNYKSAITEGRISNASNASKMAAAGIFVIKTNDNKFIMPKIVRFEDYDRTACASTQTDTGYVPKTKLFDYSDASTGKALNDFTSLIEDNEVDLVLYDLTMVPAVQNDITKHIFYSGSFILATYRGGVNIKSNGNYCQGSDKEGGAPSSEFNRYEFDYCAVNKFNFSARATGEAKINQYGEN